MPGHPVPQRTPITGQTTLPSEPRVSRAQRAVAAALLILCFAAAPMPVRAASVLSDGSVTPTSGTNATAFTFSVHYTSTDPPRPAQAVWAAVGSATVTLTKVSGTAHDGTWQGTSTLPAGTRQVTFHATTTTDPQPDPLLGPTVTVSQPPPTPTPVPPTPTPRPPPPTAAPSPVPTQPPASTRSPDPPRSTPAPTAEESPTASRSPSPTATISGSIPGRTPSPTAVETDEPSGTPDPFEPTADDTVTPPGSMLVSYLIVGGTMSLAGAAVLARQWFVQRRGRAAR